jgi:hypothetical protein
MRPRVSPISVARCECLMRPYGVWTCRLVDSRGQRFACVHRLPTGAWITLRVTHMPTPRPLRFRCAAKARKKYRTSLQQALDTTTTT